MGSNGSKISTDSTPNAVASTPKPDPSQRLRNQRVAQLVDPRSPSMAIDRTPIQVSGAVSMAEGEGTVPSSDPRSPSVGITRTPMKDSMKVTVSSFARRLHQLFLSDTDAPVEEEVAVEGDLGSSQPLLSFQPSPGGIVPAPVLSPVQSTGDDDAVLAGSSFVQLAEVEVETDLTLEEAEEAKESPLHKRLSMSLVTYHDGAPSQFYAEVHVDGPQSDADSEPHGGEPDHLYARPSTPTVTEVTAVDVVTATLEKAVVLAPEGLEPEVVAVSEGLEPEVVAVSEDLEPEVLAVLEDLEPEVLAVSEDLEPEVLAVSEDLEPEVLAVSEDLEPEVVAASAGVEPEVPIMQELTVAPPTTITQAPTGHSPAASQQPHTGIRCPTFDTKSPSQVVFKPQWLGKGFGASGLRARGVQGRGGKASSPLSVRPGGRNVGNENKGRSAKQKPRGKALMAEGRSPLQVLKATNSPIDQSTQMKLKVSTPDRQRLGQMERRVLTVALNKENR